MTFKAVIFDLDGTLLDTLADLADSTNAALADMNLPQHPIDAYRYFVGDGPENLVRRALGPLASDAELLARGVTLTRQKYAQCWDNKSRPYPGMPELLDWLTERAMPMAVLSNKPDEFTQLCVTRFLSKWQFAAVQGSTPEVPKKPDRQGALALAARLAVDPAEVLYLGDTNTDMHTAVAAGMYPVGVLWGFRPADELRASGAVALVNAPMDVAALLRD